MVLQPYDLSTSFFVPCFQPKPLEFALKKTQNNTEFVYYTHFFVRVIFVKGTELTAKLLTSIGVVIPQQP